MIVFPNCKINLGLHILRKRDDGYHDIHTVLYPVPICDALEIIKYKEKQRTASIPFTLSGQAIEGDSASNLCVKAYWLLKKDFPDLPHIQMHLHKVIPSGAGLGGGSADAAFSLRMLNELFGLALPDSRLIEYAARLGSDCPFFILNKPALAAGRGEILKELSVQLNGYKLILVNPGIHINTGDAFRMLKPAIPEISLADCIEEPVHKWKKLLVNDFEKVIFKKYPEIKNIKDELYKMGAAYASLSGSGSTVFGLFEKEKNAAHYFPPAYFIKEMLLG